MKLPNGMSLIRNPNKTAGCYDLHLYCKYESNDHHFREFPHEFQDELGSVTRSIAKEHGWVLHKDGTATCPRCAFALGIGLYSPKRKLP